MTGVYTTNGTSDTNWPNYLHDVLRLTSTKTGKAWVLDITGVQYGMYRTLWSAEEFLQTHVEVIKSVRPYPGTNKNSIANACQTFGTAGQIFSKTQEAVRRLEKAITAWVKTNDMSLKSLLKLEGEAFDQKKESLLRDMDQAVRTFIRSSNFRIKMK